MPCDCVPGVVAQLAFRHAPHSLSKQDEGAEHRILENGLASVRVHERLRVELQQAIETKEDAVLGGEAHRSLAVECRSAFAPLLSPQVTSFWLHPRDRRLASRHRPTS